MNIRQLALKIAYKIMKLYWITTKSISIGVRVIIEYEGKILLIKHSYRKGFFLPGGGVGRTEEFDRAGIREVYEETNLIIGDLELINVYRNFLEHKSNCVLIYKAGKVENPHELKVDELEIIEHVWADPKDLPKDTSFYTKEMLKALPR